MKIKNILLLAVLGLVFALSACGLTTTSSNSTTAATTTTAFGTTTTTSSTTSVVSTTTQITTSQVATTTSQVGTTQTTLRVFTLSELAAFNGNNGADAYIAVNGVVYDVTHSPQWSSGWHKGMHLAGTDCSVAFRDASPHTNSIFSGIPIVGTLVS
jgi:predicted heme/steroid binding protein